MEILAGVAAAVWKTLPLGRARCRDSVAGAGFRCRCGIPLPVGEGGLPPVNIQALFEPGGFAFARFQLLWIMPVRPCMARPSLFGSD